MGRFVSVVDGNFDWEWKFWVARQCSNFGFILEMAEGDGVYVDRYEGEDGEYVRFDAEKEKLLKNLKKISLTECPVCRTEECLEATREMVKDFAEAVRKHKESEINATLFVEY